MKPKMGSPPPLELVYSFVRTLVFIFYSLLYFARGHPSSHLPVADVGDPPSPMHVLPLGMFCLLHWPKGLNL